MGAPVLSFCRRHGKARNARTDRAWHSGQLPFRRARRGGR
jgi:hypothetical protein